MFSEIINKSISWTKSCLGPYIQYLCTPAGYIELGLQISNLATNKVIDLCAPNNIADQFKLINDYIIHPNAAILLKKILDTDKKNITVQENNKELKVCRNKKKTQKKMASLKKATPSFKKLQTKYKQQIQEIEAKNPTLSKTYYPLGCTRL